MRSTTLLVLTFCFFSATAQTSSDTLLLLTIKDTSNFRIMKFWGDTIPSKISLLNKSIPYRSERFWLKGLDIHNSKTLDSLRNDEHSVYNNCYIFKDTFLNNHISDSEKKILARKAAVKKSTIITTKGIYLITTIPKNPTGFFLQSTPVVYTLDSNWAFVDLYIYHSGRKWDDDNPISLNNTYYGSIMVVYQKSKGGKWEKRKVLPHLLL